MARSVFALAVLPPLILAGCANFKDEGWQKSRPLGADLAAYKAPLAPAAATQPAILDADPTGPVTLRQALAMALLHNPELASDSWKVRAAEARRIQAGLPPNPEIAFDIETLGALSTAERTLRLGQVIFFSGKLQRQARVAALERDLAGWDYEARRIAVYTDTAKAFVEVRAAQERLALTEQIAAISQRVVETAAERVRNGKSAPVEEMKAKVELGKVRLELESARQALFAARTKLATQWGGSVAKFALVEAPFELGTAMPPAAKVSQLLAQNPDVARWATEMELRHAVARLERAKIIPDPTLGGGVKRDGESSRTGWVAGVSIPIPIFDRNQGGIREAQYGVAQAREDKRAAEMRALRELAEAYQLMARAHAQGIILKEQILPEAQKAFDASNEGYQQGKFSYLDVVDAQRTLFDARGQWVQAVADFHSAAANIEGLTGQSLDSIESTQTNQEEKP